LECVTIDFQWPEQAVLGILTMVVTYAIHRMSKSESVTLALMFASMLATSRYFYWRVATVAGTLSAGGVNLINVCFMVLLLTAETYAFVVLYLGYIQAIRRYAGCPLLFQRNSKRGRMWMC
jgi:cellulose synthase (UDP-forming)